MLKLDKLVFCKLNRIEIEEFVFSFLFFLRKGKTLLSYITNQFPFKVPYAKFSKMQMQKQNYYKINGFQLVTWTSINMTRKIMILIGK